MSDEVALEAANYLKKVDARLEPTITSVGLCPIRPHGDYYRTLVDSIISQQLSVKAAHAIEGRFQKLFGDTYPEPERLLLETEDSLRSVGLSRPKIRYIQDLAQQIIDGTLVLDSIESMTNAEIIEMLTKVKGIGEWTAHVFLMFCLGRTDVLPVGDLGIRNGVHKLYMLDGIPSPDHVREVAISNSWHPYEAVASWYIWQSLNNAPEI